ncbi:hypothetical protein [Chryseobacterium endophyticum]|uniref:Uncharacterized protein n=1 Tax=Chryseobacterium endophyticum TaxID=1854762 RepID=A0AAU6WU48_9FLAO|nr:hypothetical protein [uncultured Chryseobacterium sp.]
MKTFTPLKVKINTKTDTVTLEVKVSSVVPATTIAKLPNGKLILDKAHGHIEKEEVGDRSELTGKKLVFYHTFDLRGLDKDNWLPALKKIIINYLINDKEYRIQPYKTLTEVSDKKIGLIYEIDVQ